MNSSVVTYKLKPYTVIEFIASNSDCGAYSNAGENAFVTLLKVNIESNYRDANFGVVELAGLMQMSTSSLARKVSEITGCAPAKLILEHRLQMACYLLSKSDEPVKNIAWLTGFHAHASFSRCFTKAYNMSPSEYREAQDINKHWAVYWRVPISMPEAIVLLNHARQYSWLHKLLIFALSEKHNHTESIPQLCKLLNTTPSTLNRKLKGLYPITSAKLIRDLRLQYASELLCSSATITEAAVTAGFFDHSHFCHSFKNAFGTFPSLYKLKDKGEMPVSWLKNNLLEEMVK
ncbi:AraC family transcriptional regulator [Mucilaginibacter sp. Bleaf8]|uniref:helix-turn-helix domain-containing protein n=1 Tax=Mucilaginibacter sp. Bleaf8 TaxID=2834430 RepID=UPI001BCF35F2|nr:AraC family transcriptional regulator [Mucilaginibacter sp. Bleaf8]MBS7564771.1 AraC family transcriptional regulator [Mucilaginibacter sp. Bleaf8]